MEKPTHINLLDHWDEDMNLRVVVYHRVNDMLVKVFNREKLPPILELTPAQWWWMGEIARSVQWEMGTREIDKENRDDADNPGD